MVQCEMCGAETGSPNTIKVEGAELDVCDDCTKFGTEVTTQDSTSSSTKYSTSSSTGTASGSESGGGSRSGGSSTSSGGGSGGSGGAGGSRGRDMFDDIDELAQDYDERLRAAREAADLSQQDLARQLNEKASLIRKLERGDVLPSDSVQRKLERALDVDLSAGGSGGDTEWEGGSDAGEYTLGDVVRRKD